MNAELYKNGQKAANVRLTIQKGNSTNPFARPEPDIAHIVIGSIFILAQHDDSTYQIKIDESNFFNIHIFNTNFSDGKTTISAYIE